MLQKCVIFITRRDFKPPKMAWDQTIDSICLKVFLKNVKNSNLEYKKNSVSFRCMLDETLYGFDLSLFAEIDENNVTIEPQPDIYVIILKKKFNGIWSRLLTTLAKVIKKKFSLSSQFQNK